MNRTAKHRFAKTALLARARQRVCQGFVFALWLLSASGAWAGFDEGMAAYQANDTQTALKEWRPLADAGNADAQYMLGRVYYRTYQNYDEAVKWYKKACEQGHAAAQYQLSGMYREGRGVQKNLSTAMIWHRKSADQGDASAQNHLGFMYDFGRSLPQNYVEAIRWYRRAAEQGHAIAQKNLGTMYSKGKGVPQNYVKAHKWFSLAASQGNDLAGSDRDRLAKAMTDDQLAQAEKLARAWMAGRGKE